ncbi:MAG: hypothetical protein AB4426_17880 [Xenococcaceae cyanobacterium]
MAQQKREKFTATATPKKSCQQKPFVQAEGELTEAQLEMIAGGIAKIDSFKWTQK